MNVGTSNIHMLVKEAYCLLPTIMNASILILLIDCRVEMQHLLYASQPLSSLTCLNILILLENLLSLPH